jgi:hypothetical protein
MRWLVLVLAAAVTLAGSTASTAAAPARGQVDLFEGWNLAADWAGPSTEGVDQVIGFLNGAVAPPVWETVAWYDSANWLQTFEQAPLPSFNTLGSLQPGEDYWLFTTGEATLTLAEAGLGDFRLNEVGFLPAEDDAPFVELINVSAELASFGGLTLESQGEQFVLPDGTVPAGGVVLVSFDGDTGVDGTVVHSPDEQFLSETSAELSLSRDAASLDRVGWGSDQPNGVNLSRGGKIAEWQAGASIGRVPGLVVVGPSAWVSYSPEQASPGATNELPAAEVLLPFDGATVAPGDTSLSWYPVRGAVSYEVEVAEDDAFSEVVAAEETGGQQYDPELGPGVYWWRVRARLASGEAAYSPAHRLNVVADGAARGGGSVIGVPLIFQHKDTTMLLLETRQETGGHAWDAAHAGLDTSDDADNMNCSLASTAMVTQWAGGQISQDRAGYQVLHGLRAGPEGDLNWGRGLDDTQIGAALSFALGGINYRGHQTLDVFWADVRAAIDAGRPLVASTPEHVFVVRGYVTSAANPAQRDVVINDPWRGTYQTPIGEIGLDTYWLLPPSPTPFNEGNEAFSVQNDGDGDGVNDFDEHNRFLTDVNGQDTDDDEVHDKQDVRASVFDATNGYAFGGGGRDFDHDGLAMELDEDSDDGECLDGQEDLNGNGRFDKDETYNFEDADDNCFIGFWKEIEHVDETFDDGFVIHRDYEFQVNFEVTPSEDGARGVQFSGEGEATFRDVGHAEGGGFCSWVKTMAPDPLTWDLEITGSSTGGPISLQGTPEQGPSWTQIKTLSCAGSFEEQMPGPIWEGIEDAILDEDGVYDHREDLPLRHPDPFDQGGTLSGEHYVEIHIERKGGEGD